MARLLIMGASHGVGLATVKAALAAGHSVRAFSRSAIKIAIEDPRLEKADGDALDATAVKAALASRDAVIQSLGVALSPATVLFGTQLFSQATRLLVDAMVAAGPQRLIVVTGISAGNSRAALGPLMAAAFQLSLRRIYDDKDLQELIVTRSPLSWTIVRPGFLDNGPATSCRALLRPEQWQAGPVSRAAVARFIVGHLDDPTYLRQTPLLIT